MKLLACTLKLNLHCYFELAMQNFRLLGWMLLERKDFKRNGYLIRLSVLDTANCMRVVTKKSDSDEIWNCSNSTSKLETHYTGSCKQETDSNTSKSEMHSCKAIVLCLLR